MRTRATTLVFLFCFLLFGPPLSHVAEGAQKPTAGIQPAERARRILSLLRDMKNAAIMYCADETGYILDDPERFRERVNRDPLAVRNISALTTRADSSMFILFIEFFRQF